MNIVIEVLKKHIADHCFRFVFPSQTAAGLWAAKTCTLGIARSVAANRFLAWDRFKEEVTGETKKEPASALMRKLFAEALVRKNAYAAAIAETPDIESANSLKGFPLKSLIPREFARQGSIFAPFIARLLPSLARWEKLMRSTADFRGDAEDEDYALVKKEYGAFLERHSLVEPSWEEIKIPEARARYVIFFPELIEDFIEYGHLLKAPQFICISAPNINAGGSLGLVFFQSAREEIRAVVMEIQRLHEEEGLAYGETAVSVPELEEMEPCLVKEFSLRHIPFTRRAGNNLGETGAGRLFPLLNECAASRFSFGSLKALILSDHIPWKEREKNKALVSFGIKYNCVSGYTQNGKSVDIWEEAFREAYNDGDGELRPYYRGLKNRILSLAGSKNFKEIRKYYFAFRNLLLDMENISEEDNAVLGRCVEELNTLIELEEKFGDPDLVPASPFAFFLSCLGEKEYVKANQKPGVNIFRWRVAAASPFTRHFVLNASQSAATVLYQPMKFLRQDKRRRLGLEDRDATASFFVLCGAGEDKDFKCVISASAQTFSGWAIPHSFFARNKPVAAPPPPGDPYKEERRFWKRVNDGSGKELGEDERFPKIYPMQKNSFGLWKEALVQKENNFSFFCSPVSGRGPAGELLENAILGDEGCLTVTATRDLNVYYSCPLLWLYARIFGAGEFSLEAALLDDTSLGLLYHKILEVVFAKIRDEDGAFDSRRLDAYKRWALEATKTVIKEHPAFKGPLALPLVSPQAAGMAKKIANLLDLEAEHFNGYSILGLEVPVSVKTGDFFIKGVIDRISVSPEGEPVIVDYKTGYLPEQTAMEDLEETGLSEFQMPLYIRLCEEKLVLKGNKASGVHGAFFYSISGRKIKTAMGKNTGGRTWTPAREEYEPFLKAAEKQIEEFGKKVKALDFVPREIRFRDCLACAYKTVCRSVYSVT